MIKEQKLKYSSEIEEISKQLKESGKYINENEDIELYLYEDKQLSKNEENKEENGNNENYVVGKYKNIYIGCLSNDKYDSREKFGLNTYIKDYFYIGQWKHNQKEGIGFLKFSDNMLYLGNFENNQINNFGMLYYKQKNNLYFGTFNNGQMDEGLYINIDKNIFYHGKFKDGKKNDKLCSYFDFNSNHIFVGEVKDDAFIRGYLSLFKFKEESKENDIETSYEFDEIIYFDKTDPNNIKYNDYHFFESDFHERIQEVFMNIAENNFYLMDILKHYVSFFENLENIVYNDSYTDFPEKYNPKENEIESDFIKKYETYYKRYLQTQDHFDFEIYKDLIKGEPKMNSILLSEIKKFNN